MVCHKDRPVFIVIAVAGIEFRTDFDLVVDHLVTASIPLQSDSGLPLHERPEMGCARHVRVREVLCAEDCDCDRQGERHTTRAYMLSASLGALGSRTALTRRQTKRLDAPLH